MPSHVYLLRVQAMLSKKSTYENKAAMPRHKGKCPPGICKFLRPISISLRLQAWAIRPFLSRNEVTVVQKPVTFRAFWVHHHCCGGSPKMHPPTNINTEKPTNTQRDLEAIFFFLFDCSVSLSSPISFWYAVFSTASQADLQQSSVNIIKVEMDPQI